MPNPRHGRKGNIIHLPVASLDRADIEIAVLAEQLADALEARDPLRHLSDGDAPRVSRQPLPAHENVVHRGLKDVGQIREDGGVGKGFTSLPLADRLKRNVQPLSQFVLRDPFAGSQGADLLAHFFRIDRHGCDLLFRFCKFRSRRPAVF